MNAAFILLATLMAVVALAFVLVPLLRRRGPHTPILAAVVLTLLVPFGALALYALVGTPQALDPAVRQAAAPAAEGLDLDSAVARLRGHLAEAPDDLQGWLLLARAEQATGDLAASAEAWRRSAALAPQDPDILAAAAEGVIVAATEHRVPEDARAWLRQALVLAPDHQRALWLTGVSDFQASDYAGAIGAWEHLLGVLDEAAGADVASAIREQLERARAALAAGPEPAAEPTTPAGGS